MHDPSTQAFVDYEDYDDDPGDCIECGGEGFVWDCFDGFCVDAESGCDDCTRPCPECARNKRERAVSEAGLKQVLADAISDNAAPPQSLEDSKP